MKYIPLDTYQIAIDFYVLKGIESRERYVALGTHG